MKQKDIALLLIIVIIAGVFSLIISKSFFTSGNQRKLTAEKVEKIDGNFPEADSKVFNSNSINPTKLIKIGDGTNPQPF